MSSNIDGMAGERAARMFLCKKSTDMLLFQPDWIYVSNGKWVCVEVKHKEKFKAPPFDGHGLDIREVDSRTLFYKTFGIRCLFLVFDKEDGSIYYEWLDVLETKEHFDTKNNVRIYKISDFNTSNHKCNEFIKAQDNFEIAMQYICEFENHNKEIQEMIKEGINT